MSVKNELLWIMNEASRLRGGMRTSPDGLLRMSLLSRISVSQKSIYPVSSFNLYKGQKDGRDPCFKMQMVSSLFTIILMTTEVMGVLPYLDPIRARSKHLATSPFIPAQSGIFISHSLVYPDSGN